MTYPKHTLFPSKLYSMTTPVQQFIGMILYKCISNILCLTDDQIRIPLTQHKLCQKKQVDNHPRSLLLTSPV